MAALHGKFQSPDRRFEWDADANPSPMRTTMEALLRCNEAIPVLCDVCGQPFWPPIEVVKGCCEECAQ